MKRAAGGRLPANLVGFARLLRAAGLPVGTDQLIAAARTLSLIDIGRRDEVYWSLYAALVTRHEHKLLFDQAFHLFWRNRQQRSPVPVELPVSAVGGECLSRRLIEGLPLPGEVQRRHGTEDTPVGIHGSSLERLQDKDFAQMSAEELAQTRALLRQLPWQADHLPTRRFRPTPRGERIDPRATLRQVLRAPPELLPLARRTRRRRPPAVVLLCDISGSMDTYARMLLHFAHALAQGLERVDTFVFATHLSNISRHLQRRDVDQALARVASRVGDWAGGTRIGDCLHRFNRDWSRRVLARGAQVVLISDGLDRSDPARLGEEMARLRRSCRRLIWLNPLLRYADFRPRARGVRAMLPYVDELRSAHNVHSLRALADVLRQPIRHRNEELHTWWRKIA